MSARKDENAWLLDDVATLAVKLCDPLLSPSTRKLFAAVIHVRVSPDLLDSVLGEAHAAVMAFATKTHESLCVNPDSVDKKLIAWVDYMDRVYDRPNCYELEFIAYKALSACWSSMSQEDQVKLIARIVVSAGLMPHVLHLHTRNSAVPKPITESVKLGGSGSSVVVSLSSLSSVVQDSFRKLCCSDARFKALSADIRRLVGFLNPALGATLDDAIKVVDVLQQRENELLDEIVRLQKRHNRFLLGWFFRWRDGVSTIPRLEAEEKEIKFIRRELSELVSHILSAPIKCWYEGKG